ncbi:hypothetical protein GCM10027425_02900 [Alteromonas gracilis]
MGQFSAYEKLVEQFEAAYAGAAAATATRGVAQTAPRVSVRRETRRADRSEPARKSAESTTIFNHFSSIETHWTPVFTPHAAPDALAGRVTHCGFLRDEY